MLFHHIRSSDLRSNDARFLHGLSKHASRDGRLCFWGRAGCNGSRDIWGWLWFSCGVAHSGGGLVSASIGGGGAFILAGGLGTVLPFYGVWTLS